MFNGKYFEWNDKKLKGILDFYGRNFFVGKKILDLGCGYADISGPLSRLGSTVTAVDAREEHLKVVNSKYPNIKTIKSDLDSEWLFSNQKFDIVLCLSLICHLKNYEQILRNIYNVTDHLVLETSVLDSLQPNSTSNVIENKLIYDLSFNGIGSRLSSTFIESLLKTLGINFKRIDSSKYNTNIYKYDWIEKNNEEFDPSKRRIWFCDILNKKSLLVNSFKIKNLNIEENIMNHLSVDSLSESKIKFIKNLFAEKFFIKKSILDAGAGYGDIGAAFAKMGASVTAADARQENLQIIKKKYPAIKTIRLNFEAPLTVNSKFDITFSIDTLCHLANYEKHLKDLCNKSLELILETAVCDSSDPNISFKIAEDSNNKMLSVSGLSNRPSAAKIEKILSENGMYFVRIDSSELNCQNFKYDWHVLNSKNQDSSLRRFWICSKREFVVKQISEKYTKPTIVNNISNPPQIIQKKIEKQNFQHLIEDNNLSVIIPAYKSEKFIDACLDSIKNQTGINNLQIIVGIDACQATLNHFEKNKEKYSDIYVYYFENNVGPYVVKNSLIDKAIYENILFFDADDILINNSILKLLENIKKYSQADGFRFRYLNFQDTQGIKSARGSDDFAHGVFLIKKSAFNSLCGFEGWKCAADTEFIERAKYNRKKIIQLNDAIFYRRLHKNSLTSSSQTGYSSKLRAEYTKAIENKKRSNNWLLKQKVTYKYNEVFNTFIKNNKTSENNELNNISLDDCGIMLIAFGFDYDQLGPYCAESIRKFSNLPILVHTNIPDFVRNISWNKISNIKFIFHQMNDSDNRVIKTQLSKYTEFKKTLYIDVDSVVKSEDFLQPFKDLDVYDIAVPFWKTLNVQDLKNKKNYNKYPKIYDVLLELKCSNALFIGGGICYFNKNNFIDNFFNEFYKNWLNMGKKQDMPALNKSFLLNKNKIKYKILNIEQYNDLSSTIIASNHNASKKIDYMSNFTRSKFNPETGNIEYYDQGSEKFYTKSKICFVYDVVGWAFYNKSYNIKKFLYKNYQIDILCKDNIKSISEYKTIITFSPNLLPEGQFKSQLMGISSKKNIIHANKVNNYSILHTNNKECFDLININPKYLLYNGVNTDFFSFSERTLSFNKKIKIGAIGSLQRAEHKGKNRIDNICEKLNDLVDNNSYFADTDKESSIKSAIEIKNYYDNIDIFIVSSVYENTPNPLLEAMSCGVPVITNNTGMAKELITNGVNGFIIEDYNNINEYIKCIKLLSSDSQLYNNFSKLGRKSVENFSWKKMSLNYKLMIDTYLKSKK